MSRVIKRLLIANAILLCGCFGGESPRLLEPVEKELGTDGPITMHYHSAVYYPDEISLQGGGYIVGIEKGDPDKILQPGETLTFEQPNSADETVRSQQAATHAGKIMFVSHIIRDQSPGSAKRNCSLFNAYYRAGVTTTPLRGCDEPSLYPPEIASKNAYRSSWLGMDTLRDSLSADIKSQAYTHIIVVVMGWNTVQEEAVRNINSIIRGIKHASRRSPVTFNPLVIGVTWPSQWNNPWFDPVYKLTSFRTKAKDADEVGLTWLGVLLGKTIPEANKLANRSIPVIAIGHSFGARAATTAACDGPVIAVEAGSRSSKRTVDLLINYQGAFLTNRLLDKGQDGSLNDKCPRARNIALTSSKNDTAVKRALWGTYAGSEKSFLEYCSAPSSLINCVKADAKGLIAPLPNSSRKFTYINADDLIVYNAFYTGGGAHSDIYRDEQGTLSWSFIEALGSKSTSSSATIMQP
ncbi:alpha/beta hydrolase [Pseudomonas sp. COR18]|uniref:alpha/beta hydrolase n=1 Tax=Pseudomonas sp. COR18 TaxID=3399680 RepID=UPI003B00413D